MKDSIQPISPNAKFGYIPCFDGLRCIAVLLVYIAHLHLTNLIPGGFGVTVFFLISGTLITRLLLAEKAKIGRIDLGAFYMRRFIRLMPAFVVMVFITTLFYQAWGRTIPFSEYTSALLYYKNYYRYASALLNDGYPQSYWGITWSLSIEEHFYLLYPAALIFLGVHSRKAMYAMLVLTAVPLFLRIIYWDLVPYPEVYNYFATEARLDSILTGCCIALLAEHVPMPVLKKAIGAPWMFWGATAGIVATLAYRDPFFQECIRYTLEQLCVAIVIFQLIYTSNHRWVAQILEYPSLKFIGRISYSIYLWHMFCIEIAKRNFEVGSPSFVLLATVLTIVTSCMSYFLVEMPLVNLRRKFGSHASKEVAVITPEPVENSSTVSQS
ncbi:acyltransferase family protein [Lacunimicrobium album]